MKNVTQMIAVPEDYTLFDNNTVAVASFVRKTLGFKAGEKFRWFILTDSDNESMAVLKKVGNDDTPRIS